ncbi:MAG TPA: hypothetical protein VLH56_19370 [Dissulfurispiraceae bacterium]|nr:hypothetical protein [Dissulfurispiraceae bacterium]
MQRYLVQFRSDNLPTIGERGYMCFVYHPFHMAESFYILRAEREPKKRLYDGEALEILSGPVEIVAIGAKHKHLTDVWIERHLHAGFTPNIASTRRAAGPVVTAKTTRQRRKAQPDNPESQPARHQGLV